MTTQSLTPNPSARRIPLTVAGSDPTGGAGVEGDLKTFLCHGLSGAAVITALTDQDSGGVHKVTPVAAAAIRRRLERLLDDLPIGGVKTGLLPSAAAVDAIRLGVAGRGLTLVVDPVLAPSRGSAFLDRPGVVALRDRLLPMATLVTPNIPELAILLGTREERIRRSPEHHAARLLETGVGAVLLKGGHAGGPFADDWWVDPTRAVRFRRRRIAKRERVHGTGCALSSAILAGLVRGWPMEKAIPAAKAWLAAAIRRAYHPAGSASDAARSLGFLESRGAS